MRKTSVRILSFVLCLVVLSGLTALTVWAEVQEYEHEPVEWKIDPKVEYIYGGEKRYDRYYVNGAFYGDAKNKFCFMNYAIFQGSDCDVYGESPDPHIVSVKKSDGYSFVFVDEEGRKILDSFLDRTDCIYYLEEFDVQYSIVSEYLVTSLDEAYDKASIFSTVNVSQLPEGEIYEITVHDKTETKAYQHGAVYILPNGHYYYVCFEDLDNSYFDADGYFSYRSGTVKALMLDGFFKRSIDSSIQSMVPRERRVVYESLVVSGITDINGDPIYDDDYSYEDSEDNVFIGVVIFYVIVVVFGILAPIPILVLGIILANSTKTGKAKSWYVLSAAAAVWILAALALLILTIII